MKFSYAGDGCRCTSKLSEINANRQLKEKIANLDG